jgi:hypothetical protein
MIITPPVERVPRLNRLIVVFRIEAPFVPNAFDVFVGGACGHGGQLVRQLIKRML